jgi:hypothetical protein
MSKNKKNEEEIKKGDVKSKFQEDIELIIDPENPDKKIKKHYGTKLVDGGGCSAIS